MIISKLRAVKGGDEPMAATAKLHTLSVEQDEDSGDWIYTITYHTLADPGVVITQVSDPYGSPYVADTALTDMQTVSGEEFS